MLDTLKTIIKLKRMEHQQKSINKQYTKNGLTDDVLEKQVKLNQKRHELNVHDASKTINGDYVQ